AAAAANLRLRLELPESQIQLPPEVEHGFYRIAQEAISNAVTHAQASALTLRLAFEPDQITLLVEDDGHGFDIRQAPPAGHYGIAGMRERAALLGGQFELDSAPGSGTRIVVRVPRSMRKL
ncbi:MAG TPA: ATP-binding protein, partial [Herpetosiphonaceae bacterium]|nr:ATP-binding protein [Herpetosiphonaceae bacterium]